MNKKIVDNEQKILDLNKRITYMQSRQSSPLEECSSKKRKAGDSFITTQDDDMEAVTPKKPCVSKYSLRNR